jgi:hypothetical protein
LGFGLLVVAGAVVVLFAMFGELYARVGGGAGTSAAGSPRMRVLPDVRVGHAPGVSWPGELARVGTADQGVLLVLSTSCASCATVASQLAAHRDPAELGGFAVVLSTSDLRRGEEFLARYQLAPLVHYLDVGGAWVTAEFSVWTSPSALVLKGGRLVAALAFSDFATLRAAVTSVGEPV